MVPDECLIQGFTQISRFQKSWGMDPAIMPSRKSFERAGVETLHTSFLCYLLYK